MRSVGRLLRHFALAAFLAAPHLLPFPARAQDSQARRLLSMVSVAVSEYGLAVDATGVVVSAQEYAEATGFLNDARGVAARLRGGNANAVRAALDSLVALVAARKPPASVAPWLARVRAQLGANGRLALPGQPPDTAAGRKLYLVSCAACHGTTGLGDGPLAHGLSTAVPAIGSRSATPALTPSLAYDVIAVGVRGTAMPAFGASLTAQQRWNVISYVYALRRDTLALPPGEATSTHPTTIAAAVLTSLDSARSLAAVGNLGAARDAAFDAYLAFEPLEPILNARDPGLTAALERAFAEFRIAIVAGDTASAAGARATIDVRLRRGVVLGTERGENSVAAFWQSLLIILREGFEAILVLGAVVALLIKTGNRHRLRSIWIGAGLGVVASLLTAIIVKTGFAAIPASQEIVEGVSLLVAVVVLFSVSYWLLSKVEAAKWQRFIDHKIAVALAHGGEKALALVAFLAVYREGAETALFYQALFSQAQGTPTALGLGFLTGTATLIVVFVLFYRFGVRIPMRPFFAVTSLLLYYMAFVFAGRGIRELQEGNIVSMTPLHIPSIPWLGIFPTVETAAIQAVLLVLFVFALLKTFWQRADGARARHS